MRPEDILQNTFGHRAFRGVQREVIDHLLGEGHALVIMPTGMGKSICFQVPALCLAAATCAGDSRPPLTLVLSPLVALMKDQVDRLRRKGVAASYVNSTLTRRERLERYAAIAQGRFQLLYVTPERFRKSDFLQAVTQRRIRLLAVDEAHCISEWGHDFRPDYSRVGEFRQLIGGPTTVALTATATPDVQRDIVRQLGLQAGEVRMFHEGIHRPNLRLEVQRVWDVEDKLAEILRIDQLPALRQGSGIVYFTLIRTLEEFSERLRRHGVEHVTYHGDLPRDRRRSIQNIFMSGRCRLVLATNAFGMGIDKEDIRYVTHAEVPGSMEAYYQEIGRAGRDGRPSLCTLLYNETDLATQMEFLRWTNPDGDFYRRLYDLLAHSGEQVRAYGMEWLNEQLSQHSRHDRRLETALALLERHDVVAGTTPPECFELTGELPAALFEDARLSEKLQRDQRKLYALVQYVQYEGDRRQFIHDYFGLPFTDNSH